MKDEYKFLNSGAFYKKNNGGILCGDPKVGCGGIFIIKRVIILIFY